MDNTFIKDDFNSGDGMLTAIWGPGLWHFLHTMSFNYPVNPTTDDKANYITSLQNVLPCSHCRKNYSSNLKSAKLSKRIFKNRETFSKFIYNLHEIVNKMLGKYSGLSYDDVRIRYEHFRARCLNANDEKPNPKIEKGCIESLYGKKSKCILQIVPKESKIKTFRISPKCKIKRFDGTCDHL